MRFLLIVIAAFMLTGIASFAKARVYRKGDVIFCSRDSKRTLFGDVNLDGTVS
jgi:hypothetical protein